MALFLSGYVMLQADRIGLAYNLLSRAAEFEDRAEIYNNMGMCLDDLHTQEAIKCYEHALKLDPDNVPTLSNLAICHLKLAKFDKCIDLCNQALKIDPESRAARYNRGLARLGKREWAKGWRDFAAGMGEKNRKIRDYGVPEWNGEPGTVVVYGEQGIGDEIMYASCIPDLQKTNKVILDVDQRLVGLFERSFECPVYGTRYADETPLVDEQEYDYQIAMGELPRFYRNKGSDFPGTPYLVPDPEREIQWGALLDSFPGRKFGVTWNGGIRQTNKHRRTFSADDFAEFKGESVVSLDYKDTPPEWMAHWPRATGKGVDFDELAALVSQLDYVVTACQTVVYVAGALGIPTYVLVPSVPMYRYHLTGDFPWFKSVRCVRQQDGEPWAEVVSRAKRMIDATP